MTYLYGGKTLAELKVLAEQAWADHEHDMKTNPEYRKEVERQERARERRQRKQDREMGLI